jgi:hypothetical protein
MAGCLSSERCAFVTVVGKVPMKEAATRIIVPIPAFVWFSNPIPERQRWMKLKVDKEISHNPFCQSIMSLSQGCSLGHILLLG